MRLKLIFKSKLEKTSLTRNVLSNLKTNSSFKVFHFACLLLDNETQVHEINSNIELSIRLQEFPKTFKKHFRLDLTRYSETSRLKAESLFPI